MPKRHPHPSDHSAIGDLFATPIDEDFSPTIKPVLQMPDRGPTWSEEFRKACELRALHQYHQTMARDAWTEFWLDIGKKRGEQAARSLAYAYRQYVHSLQSPD